MLRSVLCKEETSEVSPFRAVTVALAGTLGVGNIVGVANAVWIGGAGAIFWMWISALVAMILKYGEIVLAVCHRRRKGNSFCGGAYYYIKDYFDVKRMKRTGAVLSVLFAFLMILNALSTGCIIQVNAVSSVFRGIVNVPRWVSALLLSLLILPLLRRGIKGISALTELLVPIMSCGYLILSAAVLILRRDALGEAVASIFREACTPLGASGGVIGFLTSRALRVGVMRGLLSNEAGCGTAPTAHAAADARSPGAQGIWGVFEVFVDTIVLCTVTALVILVSFDEVHMLGSDPVMMTVRAYTAVLGDWAKWFFCAAVFCFGYATVLCWSSYAMESLSFLSHRKRWKALYVPLLWIAILIGATSAPNGVWMLSDGVIAAMTSVNLLVLWLMRREIRQETLFWNKSGA